MCRDFISFFSFFFFFFLFLLLGVKREVKLQALVYDILRWRKVPESDAGSVGEGNTEPESFGRDLTSNW